MERDDTISTVRGIMLDFAERTGLSAAGRAPRRYLWTDAHAVCNFLSLYRATGEAEFRELALALVEQVHRVLGRHRADDPRDGWISGLAEAAGREHPTAGGLRIGKPLPERTPGAPLDDRLEWDRDGQYYHYLTKWMHALARTAAVTGNPRYCLWATELAVAAHAGFAAAAGAGGSARLYWKMSIDLSRPLVRSSGMHDPVDGYVTYSELAACSRNFGGREAFPDLAQETAETAAMLQGQSWETDDALGIGGLLFDACRAAQLAAALPDSRIVGRLVRAAAASLEFFAPRSGVSRSADYRLAFRELGLSIGLHAVPLIRSALVTVAEDIATLQEYVSLADKIETFWCEPRHQRARSWLEHEDINTVMLATSLLPDEFLAA